MKISYYTWWQLIIGLRKRGRGCRESGAFLLGKKNKDKVCKIVFYDQFDKNVSSTGIIQFKGGNKFHRFLSDNKLTVLADVHTHPTGNTSQSQSDQRNPMIRIIGHHALIVPNYAMSRFLRPDQCSAYEYLGEFNWRTIFPVENFIKTTLI